MKKRYSQGGQLLSTLASLIPGGQLLSPIISGVDEMYGPQRKQQAIQPVIPITNPLGYAFGGLIQDGFKQYRTGTHRSGRDLSVDGNGIPDNNGTNKVQGKENTFTVSGQPYVMSDSLVNPNTGRTYNVDAAKANKKYKNSRFYQDERTALQTEMSNLSKLNDVSRQIAEFACGGKLKKAFGGPIDPPARETTLVYQKSLTSLSKSLSQSQVSPIDDLIAINRGMANKFLEAYNPNARQGKQVRQARMTDRFIERANGGPINGDPSVPPSENIAWKSQWTGVDGLQPLYSSPLQQLAIPALNGMVPQQVPQTFETLDRVQDRNKTNSLNKLDPYNGVALGLKTLALGRSIFDAVQPAEKERLIKPVYTEADKYIKEATINYDQSRQDVLGTSNILANANRSGSSGYNQMLGREAARIGTLGDQFSRIGQAEANANSQLNMTKGQYEANKAVDTANRQYQNRMDNQMNQANQRGFQRDLFSNLSQIGTELNKYAGTQAVIKNQKEINQFNTNQTLAFLNNKYPNLKVSPDIIAKFQNGEISIDDFLTYLPQNVVGDIKQNKK